jgi:hypothetical protein
MLGDSQPEKTGDVQALPKVEPTEVNANRFARLGGGPIGLDPA